MKKVQFILLTAVLLTSANTVVAQSAPPSLNILLPKQGSTIDGGEVEFKFTVDNFTFTDFKNFREPFPGNNNAGHAFLWLDPPAGELDPKIPFIVTSPDFHQLPALKAGRYTLTLELVQNHHASYEPRVFETVSFRVAGDTEPGRHSFTRTLSDEDQENLGLRKPTKISFSGIVYLAFLLLTVILVLHRERLDKKRPIRWIKKLYAKILRR